MAIASRRSESPFLDSCFPGFLSSFCKLFIRALALPIAKRAKKPPLRPATQGRLEERSSFLNAVSRSAQHRQSRRHSDLVDRELLLQ